MDLLAGPVLDPFCPPPSAVWVARRDEASAFSTRYVCVKRGNRSSKMRSLLSHLGHPKVFIPWPPLAKPAPLG